MTSTPKSITSKQLLHKDRIFLFVPLDEDDDLDDKEEEATEDPPDTEESNLTTEGDIPNKVVGQIFVKTLSGKTITVNDATTKTNIIDIKMQSIKRMVCQ